MMQPKSSKDDTAREVICYIGRDGIATLSCPNCKASKAIDTNKKGFAFRSFKAKCKCGESISGRFELRRHARKMVNLLGNYKNPKDGKTGDFDIENISLMGVAFRCFRKPAFQKGDHLDITFTLDNSVRSVVKLRVEVLKIEGRFVRVKRCNTESLQPTLGFYLR